MDSEAARVRTLTLFYAAATFTSIEGPSIIIRNVLYAAAKEQLECTDRGLVKVFRKLRR